MLGAAHPLFTKSLLGWVHVGTSRLLSAVALSLGIWPRVCASWVPTYRNGQPWVPMYTYGSMGQVHTMGTMHTHVGTLPGRKTCFGRRFGAFSQTQSGGDFCVRDIPWQLCMIFCQHTCVGCCPSNFHKKSSGMGPRWDALSAFGSLSLGIWLRVCELWVPTY